VNILLDNALQHFFRGCKKTSIFIKKNIEYGDGDEAGIPEPVGDGDEVHFFIPVEYG